MSDKKIALRQAGTSLAERVTSKPEAIDPLVGSVPTNTVVVADRHSLVLSAKRVFRSTCWVGPLYCWTSTEVATRGSPGSCTVPSPEPVDQIVAESSAVLPVSRKSTARTESSKCLKSPFGTTKSTHKFPANDSLTELA